MLKELWHRILNWDPFKLRDWLSAESHLYSATGRRHPEVQHLKDFPHLRERAMRKQKIVALKRFFLRRPPPDRPAAPT